MIQYSNNKSKIERRYALGKHFFYSTVKSFFIFENCWPFHNVNMSFNYISKRNSRLINVAEMHVSFDSISVTEASSQCHVNMISHMQHADELLHWPLTVSVFLVSVAKFSIFSASSRELLNLKSQILDFVVNKC